MPDRIRPTTNMMGIALLHKCNFKCEHCGYIYISEAEDHIIRPGYKLTWDQVKMAIRDCTNLSDSYWNVNYTGGEPTLWEDGDKDFMDLLLTTAEADTLPSYNTNGSYFNDYGQCHDFFHRYRDNTDAPLRTFISMDKFHKNYDEEKGRAESLDNIVKVMNGMPNDKRNGLSTHVVIVVTNDPDSSLPKEMKEHYGASGITFGEFPMMATGRAKELVDQLPEPRDLSRMSMSDGRGPRTLTLVGDNYYSRSRIVGKLGHMLDLYTGSA